MLKVLVFAGLLSALAITIQAQPRLDSTFFQYAESRDNHCVWQCQKLFAPPSYNRTINTPMKDCSKETSKRNLTDCVCDHLLIRAKFPQCVISICGLSEASNGWWILKYLNDQLSFPGKLKGLATIGFWAACAQTDFREDLHFVNTSVKYSANASIQAWWPATSNPEMNSLLSIRAEDNRLPVPFWLRRYLLPIWRQDNILSSLGYTPPPDSANITSPRTVNNLLDYKAAFTIHIFATVAYAHLLHMVSESGGYWIEAVQVLAFIFLPTLPIIQLVNSILKVFFKSSWTVGIRYNVSATCGQYIFERRTASHYRARLIDLSTHELEMTKLSYLSGQFWGRIFAILPNLYLVTARFAAYICRLRATIPGHSAIYISATGFDHRLGWVALGGLVSTLLTLLRHAVNVEWSVNPNLHLPRRSTFDWKMEIWLEIIAAAIGQSMLIRLTNRITSSTLRSRIFDLDAGRYITTISALLVLFAIQYRVPLMASLRTRSSGLRRVFFVAFVLVSASYVVLVAFLQVFTEVEEIADLNLGWRFGWNYNWRVPDPSWWML
ncbi:hypothetical protein F5882DRAFT_422089 [Hyaloscypha sp. PMI_1271]|nr:hypothetical protein F5882DRAFT_422089 [Hyaloscypha sp. PMI_1271]